jgi:son of sevenless-like protein
MTLWIGKEILSCDQPRKRCALVQKLVAIAEYCHELRNYVTIFQITAALCSSAIQRLKKTWDLVPQNVSR